MADGAARDITPPDDDFLAVGHLEHDIEKRAGKAGGVTLAAQAVKVAVQAVAIVLLARLLSPADFGLFAMVAAFLAVLEIFKDLGLSTATVQRSDLTQRQASTLFWLNLALGAAVGAALAAAAPLLVWIYAEPRLMQITPAIAVAFVFTGLSTQHLAILRRQMRFSANAMAQIGAEIAALIAAVVAAFAGLGVWALVVQRLIWAIATAAGAIWLCRWRPGRPGPLAEVRSFLHFGGRATAAMAIGFFAGSLDKVLIGWHWGAAPLGLYERAQRLQMIAIQNLNTPLANVALATLSRLTGDPERYRRVYLGAVGRLALVIAPIGGLLVGGAEPIVRLLLGDQWTDAAPIMAWMSVAMVYLPITYAMSWLFMSQDRMPEMLKIGMINAGLTVGGIIVGLPFGPLGVAIAFVASGAMLRAPLLFWMAGRRGPVRTGDLYPALALPALGGVAVALVVAALRRWTTADALPLPLEVAVLSALAFVSTLVIYALFPTGRRALADIRKIPSLVTP